MVRSMTGFGTGTLTAGGWRAEATIRTLNHRYLSVHVRTLRDRPQLQMRLEEAVKQAFRRGEIDVWIAIDRQGDAMEPCHFDHKLLGDHLTELRHIASELSLLSPPTLGDLIQVGAFQAASTLGEDLWPIVEPALQMAIEAACAARAKEGTLLAEELEGILEEFSLLLTQVKERLPEVIEELRTRLQERVTALNVEVEPNRLEMEVVLLAERFDVREEVTRLEAHLSRAKALLETDGAIGKRLNFLSQELLREVNTLGAKSRDLDINSLVIDMKMAIERFKEQVQNVE